MTLEVEKQINKVLDSIGSEQLNLASAQARKTIASIIARSLVGKFYMVPFVDREELE